MGQSITEDATHVIEGRITDEATGQGVAYATLYCKACAFGGTITSEEGTYILTARDSVAAVTVNHIMYRERTLRIYPAAADFSLQLEALDLPEVTVNGTEGINLVKRAYTLLDSGKDQFYRGEGFYRQTTQMNSDYSELFEYFVKVKYSNKGIADWDVVTGRYAVNPIPDRLQFENQSYFTRGFKVYKEEYRSDQYIIPINPATFMLYDYRVVERIKKESGTVLVVDCQATDPQQADDVIAARLYIDSISAQLLQADYVVHELALSTPERGTYQSPTLTASIKFRATDNGHALIQSVRTQTTFRYVKDEQDDYAVSVKSLYLNFPPTSINGTVATTSGMDFVDLREAAGKKYKAKWWDRHPVVAATPIEWAVIDQFNEQAYFGNYFAKRTK
jgi:hypothetical protein